MAEIKKDKDVIDKAFDPKKLTNEELRNMYARYSKYKPGYVGRFVTWPKDIYMNIHKLMTFTEEHGWAHYMAEGQSFAEWSAKWCEYENYWNQYIAYQNKRKYAESQSLASLDVKV